MVQALTVSGQIPGRPRDPERVAAPKARGRGPRPIDDPGGVAAPGPGGSPGPRGEAPLKLRWRSPRPDAIFRLAAAFNQHLTRPSNRRLQHTHRALASPWRVQASVAYAGVGVVVAVPCGGLPCCEENDLPHHTCLSLQ